MRLFHRPFLPVLLAFAAGIRTGGLLIVINCISIQYVIIAAIVCFGLTIAELLHRKQTLVFPLLLFWLLGWLSITPYLNPHITNDHILNYVNNTKYRVTGVVVTNPEFVNDRQSFEVAVKTVTNADGVTHAVKGKIHVNYGENALSVPYGAEIEFKGYLREIHSFVNPSGFDYERFMLFKRVYANLYVNPGDMHVFDPQAYGSGLMRLLYRFKAHAAGLIERNTHGLATGILEALLTGNRKNIEQNVTDAFSKTGLSHVLAISGLHVGIVSLFFCTLFMLALRFVPYFKQDYRRRSLALLLALAPVLIYCVFSGFSPSTKRAFIVLVIFIAGFASLRVQDGLNSAITAALLILLAFPDALYSVSFQLSFAAIFGIMCGYRFLNATGFLVKIAGNGVVNERQGFLKTKRATAGIWYWLVSCFFMSLFAILATTPIVMHYFFNSSWSGLLLNLIMIPLLTFIVLPLGVLALLLSWWPWAAGILLKICSLCLNFVIEITLNVAALPHTTGKWFAPSIWEIACYYAVFFGLLYWLKPQKWHLGTGGFLKARLQTPACRKCFVLILIGIIGLGASAGYWLKDRYYRNNVKVTFIDIGQGNATFLEFPNGKNLLIDGGGFRSTSGFDVGQNVLEPFLRHRKVAAIDTIILTHGDYDHVGGLFYIVQNFKVRQVWLPDFASKESQAFMECMSTAGVKYEFIHQGEQLPLAPGYTAEFYNPPADITKDYLRKKPDVNDCSLVFKIWCDDYSLLFTGDISKQVEAYLVDKYGAQLKSDILLSPHHGSKTSNTQKLVEAVKPAYVVFSAGYNNYYNFPNPDVMERYAASGATVLRTDLMGAIEFIIKAHTLNLKTYRQGATPPCTITDT